MLIAVRGLRVQRVSGWRARRSSFRKQFQGSGLEGVRYARLLFL